MIAALARPSVARLVRTPRAWIGAGAWFVLAIAFALLARSGGSAHAADHALSVFGSLSLPLVVYVVAGSAIGRGSLAASASSLALFGASRARAALVAVAVTMVASAIACALLGATVAALGHGVSDPPLAFDALASAYAGALGGAAYAAWFALGSSFGARGGGRTALLVLDWILGATSSVVALPTPRAHVRNLLGGAPPVDLPQRASAAALVLLATAYVALSVLRSARAPRAADRSSVLR